MLPERSRPLADSAGRSCSPWVFCSVALRHVRESLSGCGLHVRILPSSVQPVIPRQGERPDAGPVCATVNCESPVFLPTRICHLADGMVDGLAEMRRVIGRLSIGTGKAACCTPPAGTQRGGLGCWRWRRRSLGRCSVRQRPRVLGAWRWRWRCATGRGPHEGKDRVLAQGCHTSWHGWARLACRK